MENITFDFNNMLAHAVGSEHGIATEEIESLRERLVTAHRALETYRAEKALGFLDLPYQDKSQRAIRTLADRLARTCDNFVVLGIGGSALGNIALHRALRHPYFNLLLRAQRGNRPRIFVCDNVDPDEIAGLLDTLDLRHTCFNVISKSGDTVETMASYLLVRDILRKKLGKARYAGQLVATTSAKTGALRDIAREEGYATLEIPENVGGRFSVLSAVGLLSAAVSGISIEKLCQGAQAMDKACRSGDATRNPALLAAALHYLAYRKGKHISVLMPYTHGLKEISDWYAQLWAESLGKKNDRGGAQVYVGSTPVKALGVTDQHSQLQLYQEGPFDKVVTFVTVEKFHKALKIPSACPQRELHYLAGHTFADLIHAEQKATQLSLTRASRMNAGICLSAITPRTVGMLLYFFELQTAYAGELFNINAFDQPGVETGKQFAYGILGRKGYEAKGKEFGNAAKPRPEYLLRVRA